MGKSRGRAGVHSSSMPELYEYSEDALLMLARQGDGRAFVELIARGRPVCLTVARSILGPEAEVEDVMQNAFIKAWSNVSRFREESSFATWLCRIVTNECLMLIRRRQRHTEFPLHECSESEFPFRLAVPQTGANPEELVASREINDLLKNELGKVPRILRGVLVLAEVHELTTTEIAARLNLSVPAVKSRLIRARRELRRRVEMHGGRMGLGTLVSQRAWAGGTRP